MGSEEQGARLVRARSGQSAARKGAPEKGRGQPFCLSDAILKGGKMRTKESASKQAQDGGDRPTASPAARAGSLNEFDLPWVVLRLPWRLHNQF